MKKVWVVRAIMKTATKEYATIGIFSTAEKGQGAFIEAQNNPAKFEDVTIHEYDIDSWVAHEMEI